MPSYQIKLTTEDGVEKTYGMDTPMGKEAALEEFKRQQKLVNRDGLPYFPAGEPTITKRGNVAIPEMMRGQG